MEERSESSSSRDGNSQRVKIERDNISIFSEIPDNKGMTQESMFVRQTVEGDKN